MPKKNPFQIFRESFLPSATCRPAVVIRWFVFFLAVLPSPGVSAQTDTGSVPEETVPEMQDTLVVSRPFAQKSPDSVDLYLSTDTNTRDVSGSIDRGYVMASQELRHIKSSAIRRHQSEEAFVYANDPAYWRQEIPASSTHFNLRLSWRIFLMICAAFLIYGIYRLSKENFSGLFRRRVPTAQSGTENDPEERLLSPDELEKKLSDAIAAADFRAAVRLLYLRLIRLLEERQLVPAGTLSTNRAWATVFSDPAQSRQFRALSGAYEYVFYGGFEPDEKQFAELSKRFAEFSQNLSG